MDNNPIQLESGEQGKTPMSHTEAGEGLLKKKARCGWMCQSRAIRREKEARMSLGERIISSQQRETTIGILSIVAVILLVAIASTAIIVTRTSSVKDDGAGGHMLVDKSTGDVLQTAHATHHSTLAALAESGDLNVYEKLKSVTIPTGIVTAPGSQLSGSTTASAYIFAVESTLWINRTRMVITGVEETLVLVGGGEAIVMGPPTASIYFTATEGGDATGHLAGAASYSASTEADSRLVEETRAKCDQSRCPLPRCTGQATEQGLLRNVQCNNNHVWSWPAGVSVGNADVGGGGMLQRALRGTQLEAGRQQFSRALKSKAGGSHYSSAPTGEWFD